MMYIYVMAAFAQQPHDIYTHHGTIPEKPVGN